ncbi:MAG: hypothetical protein PWR29_1889 [Methanolobus sp.]|jgi:hypothetical protein|nr:hypothetical protein [Methanolobus sp.]MDK2912932.1 hypothetical protein [Methanolobus sp.]MDN5309570.1 hypothetical protein [Methanolobus sp.]
MVSLKQILLKENVGGLDLVLRAFFGSLALSALALGVARNSKWKWVLALIGLTGLVSSITRHCTPYVLLGINTATPKESKGRDYIQGHETTRKDEMLQETMF